MKKCHICGFVKDKSEFGKNASKTDGLQSRCKECDRKLATHNYHTKYKQKGRTRAKNRRKALRLWMIELKKTLRCSRCQDDRWYVIDFHHRGDKNDTVSHLVANGCSKKKIASEIEKCIPLCANCHREIHYKESLLG